MHDLRDPDRNRPITTEPDSSLAPFLIPDPQQLARKLQRVGSPWAGRWQDFLRQANVDEPSDAKLGIRSKHPIHAGLAWIATGVRQWADRARVNLLRLRDQYPALLERGVQDFDTWIFAAQMARYAITLDWIWDAGVLSNDERDALADLFVTDSLKHPFVTLHHRVPPHANNQGMAMALNLVVVGHLFGQRRASDPRARLLLEVGLRHLHQQIAWLPPGGYSGEGSTYVILVEEPLLVLACASIEAITGEDYFSRSFAPHGNSVKEILSFGERLMPPSGVLPGCDQHGFQLGVSAMVHAYLAQRGAEPERFAKAASTPFWYRTGSNAWMLDDHVWTWLWAPEAIVTERHDRSDAENTAVEPWASERVGGTLISTTGDLHLLQLWDTSTWPPIRFHMNPNALQLEAFGSLLTVDGNALPEFPLAADPRMHWTHWYKPTPTTMSWSDGSLGAHGVIIVDGAIQLHTGAAGYNHEADQIVTGRLLRHETGNAGLQVIAADTADVYQSLGVTSAVRSSAMVDEALWVVVDDLQATDEHDYTAQWVLRHGAQKTEQGLRLRTAEHVVMDIISLDGPGTQNDELVDVPGYPSLLEQKCHHYRRTRRGRAVRFVTLMAPQLGRRELAVAAEPWLIRPDPNAAGEAAGWHLAEPTLGDWRPATLEDLNRQLKSGGSEGVCWVSVQLHLPELVNDAGRRFALQLPCAYEMAVWVDGEPVTYPALKAHHHGEPRPLPPFADVTSTIRGKGGQSVTVHLRLSGVRMYGVSGEIRLHETFDPPVPTVQSEGDGQITVTVAGQSHRVNLAAVAKTPAHRPPIASKLGEDPQAVAEAWIDRLGLHRHGAAARPIRENDAALAVELMHEAGPAADATLIRLLDHEDWVIKMMAAYALGERRCAAAVSKLSDVLLGETPAKMKTPAYFCRYRLKTLCVIALGKIGDPAAAAAVATCLTRDDFHGVRRVAAEALSKIGGVSVLQALQEWTDDSDAETAGACQRAVDAIRVRTKP